MELQICDPVRTHGLYTSRGLPKKVPIENQRAIFHASVIVLALQGNNNLIEGMWPQSEVTHANRLGVRLPPRQ